jgi:hypothetical protein
MNEENGAALKLLYQLKLSLERHLTKKTKTVTGLRPSTVDSKSKRVSELSKSLSLNHKKFGIEGPTFKHTHKPLIAVENKLLKFEYARASLQKKAKNDDMAEISMLKSLQQTKRQ